MYFWRKMYFHDDTYLINSVPRLILFSVFLLGQGYTILHSLCMGWRALSWTRLRWVNAWVKLFLDPVIPLVRVCGRVDIFCDYKMDLPKRDRARCFIVAPSWLVYLWFVDFVFTIHYALKLKTTNYFNEVVNSSR